MKSFTFHNFVALYFLVLLGCNSSSGSGTNQDSQQDKQAELFLEQNESEGTISVFRKGEKESILTQNAKEDFRPYIHPIVAPDGKGILTEYSPGHHGFH